MKIKKYGTENQPSEAILESHISSYLDKVGFVLFWILLTLTLSEVVVCILVKMGYFSYFLEFQNNIKITHYQFTKIAAFNVLLIWGIYTIYLISFHQSNFKHKKVIISVTVMLLTSVICFGHWKYSYLSILYSIPIIFTAPFGKKNHNTVFIVSIILSVLYSILQYRYFRQDYNFLIFLVTEISITTFYLISKYNYLAMLKSLTDLEKYFLLIDQLNHEISHDFVTGAFSKQKLKEDFENNINISSIAFIDLDNFKTINDSKGHNIGDKILKIFTKSFLIRNIDIYRYGGDEFVILSNMSVKELANKLEQIKGEFSNVALKLFSCNTSFSAGVIHMNKDYDIESLLKKCDNLMYIAKKNGKNTISTDEQNSDSSNKNQI